MVLTLPQMTLVVDGSYGDRGHAGWAAWYKADGMAEEMVGGTVGKELFDVQSSNDAEAAAMVLGLTAALDYAPRHSVLLQSDSKRMLKAAMNLLGWTQRPARDGHVVLPSPKMRHTAIEILACRLMAEVAELAGASVVFRYVRGHTHGIGQAKAVHTVHAKCDILARKHMRRARVADGLSPAGSVMLSDPVDGMVCES